MKKIQTLKHSRFTKKRQDIIFASVALAYPLLMFVVFYIVINLNSFVMAFQKNDLYGNVVFVGFDNFIEYVQLISKDGDIMKTAFLNSMIKYAIGLIGLPITILFAYLLYKKCFAHSFIRAFVMIPQIVSSMVISLLFKKFLDNALPAVMDQVFGIEDFPYLLTDSRYAFGTTIFYSIWISFSMSIIVYSNAMSGIDKEIVESAQLDGVDNMFLELWYIVLPLIYSTISTYLITGLAAIFSDGGPILTFFMDKAPASLYNMGYYYTVQIMNNNASQYNMLSAGGMIMTLLVAPITLFLRWFLEKVGPEVN